jgi:hypothetical protein
MVTSKLLAYVFRIALNMPIAKYHYEVVVVIILGTHGLEA